MCPLSVLTGKLTNDPEDAQDVGGEDDEHVDAGEEDGGDGDVPQPAEGRIGKEHLLDGPAHLRITAETGS